MRASNAFYATSYKGEVLSQPNPIVEDLGTDPEHPLTTSVLDTLYYAAYGDAGAQEPVMTYYRGRECGPVLFSGFPVWYFQRAQAIQLVDFVMHQVWGLTRRPVPR
jgi:hypothetical protein